MDKYGADVASLTYTVNFLNGFVYLCGSQMKFPPLTSWLLTVSQTIDILLKTMISLHTEKLLKRFSDSNLALK